MPTVKSVDIKWNNRAINQIDTRAKEGLFDLAFDIAAQARRNAPIVTGALRNSIRTEREDNNTIYVIAGGIVSLGRNVDYAWRREQGPNRNPATEHYMENAANSIMTGDYLKKYFGKVTK